MSRFKAFQVYAHVSQPTWHFFPSASLRHTAGRLKTRCCCCTDIEPCKGRIQARSPSPKLDHVLSQAWSQCLQIHDLHGRPTYASLCTQLANAILNLCMASSSVAISQSRSECKIGGQIDFFSLINIKHRANRLWPSFFGAALFHPCGREKSKLAVSLLLHAVSKSSTHWNLNNKKNKHNQRLLDYRDWECFSVFLVQYASCTAICGNTFNI